MFTGILVNNFVFLKTKRGLRKCFSRAVVVFIMSVGTDLNFEVSERISFILLT